MKRRQCVGESTLTRDFPWGLFRKCLAQRQNDLTPPLPQNDRRGLNAFKDPTAFERLARFQKSDLTADVQNRNGGLILHDSLQCDFR